jgi:hypothetical protein
VARGWNCPNGTHDDVEIKAPTERTRYLGLGYVTGSTAIKLGAPVNLATGQQYLRYRDCNHADPK